MLSRVADSIFWMARYIERTNGMLRLLRYSYLSSQDEIKDFSWQYVLNHYSDDKTSVPLDTKDSSLVLHHLLLDKKNASSVINTITKARENARGIQDHITKEVWQCLNDFYHLIRHTNIQNQIKQGDTITALDSLISHGWLYYGVADTTMARGTGYAFLSIGKFIERAILTTNNLSIKLDELNYNLDDPIEIPALRYLLYSLSGYELYLKTHKGNLKSELVLKQILYNPHYPYSLLYSLTRVTRYIQRLQPESIPESYERLEYLTGKLMNHVKYASIDIQEGKALEKMLNLNRQSLFEIGNVLNEVYFGHLQ